MITLFTDPTGLVPVVTGLITTGHSHFPADPTGLVPVVNRFDHYINGRLTSPVCSFQTLLPPAQGRWGAFLLGDALHSSQTLLPPAQGRWGVLHANIYIMLKLTRMRGLGIIHFAILTGYIPKRLTQNKCQSISGRHRYAHNP